MEKVTNIGDYANNAKMVSPEMCVKDCLENFIGKKGAFKKGKKLLILCLDDDDGLYAMSYMQAGMKVSEMVSMIEIAKNNFISEMDL